MRALECAVKDEINRRAWEEYTATNLWCIGKMFAKDSWRIPSYIDVAHPNIVKTDNRTASEVISDLKARLS